MRTLHVTLVVMAIVTLSAALAMHLSITSPSLFTDGAYRAPSSMDLYVNGILVEKDVDLPMTISMEEGDVVRLEGHLDDFDAGRRAFMLTTDASIFRIYADGRLVASDGYGDDLTDFFRMHHGSPQMNIGFFPQDMDVDEIAIEFECIALARGRQIDIDSLVLGSSWDIISLFRNTIRLFACLLVIHATIFVAILAIVSTHWKTASPGILLILAFEALMIAQTVIGIGVRDLFHSNELLWQILEQVAASPYPILFLAMTRRIDHVACLSSTRHRLMSLLPMAMLSLSALSYPVSAQASHFLFHLTKGANLVVCLTYTIAMALEKEEASRHLITFSLMMDAAFMLELVNVPSFSTFNALHCLSNVIRLVAVMTYITFTISHYLTSEKIVIGQLGLDDMLYRDSLTGCYTRRNLDEFIHDDEAIRGRRLHILFYDLDALLRPGIQQGCPVFGEPFDRLVDVRRRRHRGVRQMSPGGRPKNVQDEEGAQEGSQMSMSRSITILTIVLSIIAIVFSAGMAVHSAGYGRTVSEIYGDPIYVVEGMDVTMNGELVAQDIPAGQWLYEGPYAFSDTFTFTVDLSTFPHYIDPSLCFRSRSAGVHVYQGGNLVYSIESHGGQNPPSFDGGRYNLVTLDGTAMEGPLSIVFETTYMDSSPLFDPVFFGNRTSLVIRIVARNVPSLIIGMSMVAASLLIAFLSLTLQNRQARANLMSAVFLIAITGTWILTQNWSRQFFFSNVTMALDVSYLMMALLPLSMLHSIRMNYDIGMHRSFRFFEHFSYLMILMYVVMYVPYLLFARPYGDILIVMAALLAFYFLSLVAVCLHHYVKRRFPGGLWLVTGLASYLSAIVIEQVLLTRESILRVQISIYLPYYIALFIFLFRAAAETMRNSRSATEKRRILEMAYMDTLTGVLNRNALDDRLERISRENRRNIYIFMFDIDGMKRYNDTFGHKAGDMLVRSMAESLKEATLDMNRYIFRYGGDEFLLMVEDEGELDTARIVDDVRNGFRRLAGSARLDFSVGVVRYDRNIHKNIVARLGEADAMMYYDKQDGSRKSTPPRRRKGR